MAEARSRVILSLLKQTRIHESRKHLRWRALQQ